MHIVYDYVETYMDQLWAPETEDLAKMREYAEKNHIPIIEREIVEFLKVLLDISKPKHILELGTAIGYSSIVMAKSSKNSLIDTVELKEETAEYARKNIADCGFNHQIKVTVSDALEYLKNCNQSYDFIFIDAAKGHYEKYIKESLRLLNPNGTILCDDVLFRGMVPNNDLLIRRKITIVKRMRALLPKVLQNKELLTSLIPIADGLLLIRRKN